MTLDELENQLPNGLHDAKLMSFFVNLEDRSLKLKVEIDHSSPDPEVPSLEPCPVEIMITGLCYFSLNPPDPGLINGTSWISAGNEVIEKKMISPEVAAKLPSGAFLHYIFLGSWNALMLIGGMDARIEFLQI